MSEPLLRVRDLKVHYPLFKGFAQRLLGGGGRYVHAVDGVTFEIEAGEVFGLVGESGCGKSTTGRALMGLTPVSGGEIVLQFPPAESLRAERVRPLGLWIACVFWLGLAAAYELSVVVSPAGPWLLIPGSGPAVAALALVLAVTLALLTYALFGMRPWSRRPARLLAVVGALFALPAPLPQGLVIMALQLAVAVYLGTPAIVGLVRRSGWLVPVTRFVVRPEGIAEGDVADTPRPPLERLLFGPRWIPTRGFSWLLKQLRAKVQIVYQDPHAALSPALSLGEALEHALTAHWTNVAAAERTAGNGEVLLRPTRDNVRRRALRLLEDVGLRPPEQFYAKFPAEISGGQKQRVVIARSIAPRPQLLVADEPVALLDMSIRARILELLLDLKRKYGLTYVFITHDLATAKLMCHRIAIMYLGRIVEMGESSRIFAEPKHPYTRALLQAIPVPDPRQRKPKVLPKGEVPDAVDPPAGCRFHPRCPVALPSCGWEGRDFIDLLEEQLLELERFPAAAALGPAKAWRADGPVVRRSVGPAELAEAVSLVRAVLQEGPSPLREAVADVRTEDGILSVLFRPPAVLTAKEVDGRIVECLLY